MYSEVIAVCSEIHKKNTQIHGVGRTEIFLLLDRVVQKVTTGLFKGYIRRAPSRQARIRHKWKLHPLIFCQTQHRWKLITIWPRTRFDITVHHNPSNHHLHLGNRQSRLTEYRRLNYYTPRGGLFVRFLNVPYGTSGLESSQAISWGPGRSGTVTTG